MDSRLRLKETLQRCLAQSHLFQLRLLVALLGLSFGLGHFLGSAASHGVHHGFDIENFTTERHPSLSEWVAPLFNVFSNLVWQFLSNRVRKNALSAVTITVAVDSHVLEGHQVQVNLLVVLVRLVVHDGELAEILGLFLAYKDNTTITDNQESAFIAINIWSSNSNVDN